MRKIFALFCALGLLAGCASPTPVASSVAGLQSAYIAAASAESVYISSGKASPAVVTQIEKYRLPAYNAIEPLVQAEESGTSVVTAAETEAAQLALTQLTAYLATQKIGG